MKKTILQTLCFIAILWLAGCTKHEPVDGGTTEGSTGTATDIGNPAGERTHKTIGPEGGVLTSTDKNIRLTIPAGAVSAATDFSIQPIENHAPNGLGFAYRLLPEGTHFEKPVTLTFTYTDSLLTGSTPECLFIAYQGKDRIWKAHEVSLNETSKTVSVRTTHFSDWSLFASFRLSVAKSFIDPNESTTLAVKEVRFGLANLINGQDVYVVTTSRKVTNWTLAGEGRLAPNGAVATYTAPSEAPAMNPVTVSAEIDNLVTNRGNKGKVMVLAPITIGGEFMDLTFGGVSYHLTLCTTQKVGGYLMINAVLPDMIGVGLNISGSAVGWYPVTHEENGTFIIITPQDGNVNGAFTDNYLECGPPGIMHYVEASVSITKIGKVGENIEGTFSGEVARNIGDCGHEVKKVFGTFMVKRRA
jgi:hypothetical protein